MLVNKYFGPVANAGYSIANSVNAHCTTLAAAMRSAFIPALTTICGSGDYGKMRSMAMQSCKFATLLALVFMLPLALELPQVIELWLKSPPPHVAGLCWCMMAASVLDYIGMGQSIAICAFGKVARYQLVVGISRLFMLPMAWALVALGCNIYAIGAAYVVVMLIYVVARALLSVPLAKLSVREWLTSVVFPIAIVLGLTLIAGSLPHMFMNPTLFRIVVTSFITVAVLVSMSWVFVLKTEERNFLLEKAKRLSALMPRNS